MTLYKAAIPVLAGEDHFRVYFWHVNETDAPVNMGFQVSFEDLIGPASCVMTELKWVEQVVPKVQLVNAGKCFAQAQIAQSYEPQTPVTMGIDTVVWQSGLVPKGTLIACLCEFKLAHLTGGLVKFRSFATQTAYTGTFSSEVWPADSHVRGWWPRSTILIRIPDCNPFDLQDDYDPLSDGIREVGICERDNPLITTDDTPELSVATGFGKQVGPGHEYDTANVGCYGVDLIYRAGLNSDETAFGASAWFLLRNRNVWTTKPNGTIVDTKFFGAARIIDVSAGNQVKSFKVVPPLPHEYVIPGPTLLLNSVNLLEGGSPEWIPVPKGPTKVIDVHVVVGGAAATPVQLLVVGLDPSEA